ncbi:hypothetical protein J7400_15620 [Shimia sp. R9_2]|uniref:hypothetical protein n=1 Tax=Shimia sp. R9_2 TaxID=2821112 RepID=UPI001ADAF709|nr:hypothetical protein [Shimia sp. R9_2]MBO9398117.1 hypothetical protein [Shimia sp. R9_2]
MISEIDKQVALARESNQKWIAIPPEQKFGKFEVESLALFRLLASQCGSWPTSVEFVLHLGLEGEMLHTAPAVTKIYARLSNGEYVFEYQNLQSLREFAQDAINVQNEIRSDFAKALREREDRISAWHSREGRFAMGALIVAGILGGAGVLSPCNDNDPDNDPVMLDCFW